MSGFCGLAKASGAPSQAYFRTPSARKGSDLRHHMTSTEGHLTQISEANDKSQRAGTFQRNKAVLASRLRRLHWPGKETGSMRVLLAAILAPVAAGLHSLRQVPRMSDWHLSRSGVNAIAQARPRNGRKYAPPPRRATAAVADADMATEAFDSLTSNRPSDGDAFSCALPAVSYTHLTLPTKA